MASSKVFMRFAFCIVVLVTLNNIWIDSKNIQVLQSINPHASGDDQTQQDQTILAEDSNERINETIKDHFRNGTVNENDNITSVETSLNIEKNVIYANADLPEYRINVKFYVDQAMNDTYKEKLDRHLQIIYHHVSLLFKPGKIGQQITISVSKQPTILPASVFGSAMQNGTRGYQYRLLRDFCKWEYSTRSGGDHLAFLITKNGLCDSNCPDSKSESRKICDSNEKCAVFQDKFSTNVQVIATKIGEFLGMKRDGSSDCTDKYPSADLTGYIMSSTSSKATSHEWSICSKNRLTSFLSSPEGKCLGNVQSQSEDFKVVENSTQWLYAKQYDGNEQCAIYRGIGSIRCPFVETHGSCAEMACTYPDNRSSCFRFLAPWIDLTPCGKNRACLKGRCQLFKSIEKNGVHDNSSSSVITVNETKVSTGPKEYRINILVYVDEDIKDKYKEKLEKYLKYVFHHVSLLYEEKRTGHRIIVAMSKQPIVVHKNVSDNFGNKFPNPKNISWEDNDLRIIRDFCYWQLETKTSDDHDLALFIQKKNLCGFEGKGRYCPRTANAMNNAMCTDYNCVLIQDFYLLPLTIAHEIGHTMNVYHDESEHCNREFPEEKLDGYIMNTMWGLEKHPFQWSNCSKRGLTNFLRSLKGECLENHGKDFKDFEVMANSREWLMAEHFSRDDQCRFMFENSSVYHSGNANSTKKCDPTLCQDPNTGGVWTNPGLGWHDVTPCEENY